MTDHIEHTISPANMTIDGLDAFFTTKIADNDLNKWNGRVFYPIQRHTDNIYILNDNRQIDVAADAVITDRRGILIGVKVADCVPILLYDRRRDVIGAVHAGWRGTAKGILKKTIKTMSDIYGSCGDDILIAIGPSIKGCCYEVGVDVMESVYKATGEGEYYKGIDGRHYLDLSMANIIQAQSMGVPQDNIWYSDECTFCNPLKFYSYRYSGTSTGRQGGFIGMW